MSTVEIKQVDREAATILLDNDQWSCGCPECHAEVTELFARHRQAAERRGAEAMREMCIAAGKKAVDEEFCETWGSEFIVDALSALPFPTPADPS